MELGIYKINSRNYLKIGDQIIQVSDYSLKKSSEGNAELSVTFQVEADIVGVSTNMRQLNAGKNIYVARK